MATITIQINQGGSGLANASIIVGDIAPAGLTTNESGTITKTVTEDYRVFVAVTILHNNILNGRRDYGLHLFEAGNTYTFNV